MPPQTHELNKVSGTACHTTLFALLFQKRCPASHLCIDSLNLLWIRILQLNGFPIQVTHEIAKIARKLRQHLQRILLTIENTESFRKFREPSKVIRDAIERTKSRGKRRKREQLIAGTIEFNQIRKRRERGDTILTAHELL